MSFTNDLPPLDQDRVDAMEHRIVMHHRDARSGRRRRVLTIVGAAASVLVLAAVVGPVVSGGGFAGQSGSTESGAMSADLPTTGEQFVAPAAPRSGFDASTGDAPGDVQGQSLETGSGSVATDLPGASSDALTNREIITTASANVRVTDIVGALAQISATASALGGYVESSDSSSNGVYDDPATTRLPTSSDVDSGYITIRIPAEKLGDAQNSLAELGTVTGSSTNRQDVTTQAVDLRARIEATQASVDRLQTLMSQAGSVSDLLAAETQLAERQATLESYQQQLTALESQVSLSSLTVSLSVETPVQTAEPAGFLDGLVSGWNGLVASANGLLIGLGFLLPWLIVAGAVVGVLIAVRRLRRRRASRVGDER